MGVVCYFYLGNTFFNSNQFLVVLIQFLIITICIPITIYFLLKAMEKVDSVMMETTSQRKLPLLFQLFLLAVLAHNSIKSDNMPELHYFLIGGIISGSFAFLFLFLKTKVSLHMIGISSLTVFMIGLSIIQQTNYLVIIAILLLLNGLVASSRLLLKAHTPTELILGTLIGVFSQLMTWKML